MASFLSKLRAVTLGAAHDLLDKTIDLNSPSVVRQYVRDLEGAIDKLQTEQAIQAGGLRTLQRERGEVAISIENDKATIQKLQEKNATDLARNKAKIVLQNQQRLKDLDTNISNQQQTVDSLSQAVTALNAKHGQMVIKVHDLERLDRDSKAKESAASAINNAGKIAGNADSASIDDLTDRMERRHDVADAKFGQAMGNFHVDDVSGVDSDDVDALMAELAPKPVAVA